MNRLAHLNGIRAFEATARHLSFSQAANELNVTPAAVGQQVKQLEEWLGVQLFIRSNSGQSRLKLTEEAKLAYPDIQQGFSSILNGLGKLNSDIFDNTLRVAVSPSIGSKWLMPRIADFQAQFPEYDLRVETHIKPVDYTSEGIDVGIRYGRGEWENVQSDKLMDEAIFPVCSPEFAAQHSLSSSTSVDWSALPLLHDLSVPESQEYPSWQEWFTRNNIPSITSTSGLKVNSFSEVIEAAIRGQGLALGREALVMKDLEEDKLIRPFGDASYCSSYSYYVVSPIKQCNKAKAKDFRTWLITQI
ncbi:HTH-type transcriptional regulator, LysR-family protein [Vibrio nigripulchritudo ATCC 27043]|uniref:LysR substrate-binding domain-containing protein n=1 Tax=Vibrio nigripulchritudo TaxID=28173 RepID=UPI00021C22D7|nr:LysR substrate-binding domain-containing protein [Vibrio nigripulchritudo]EGU58985.1 HTH-type transcriptional regulator, LysR-family protein [Vibrio nigripulchritudo ATCC 27043]